MINQLNRNWVSAWIPSVLPWIDYQSMPPVAALFCVVLAFIGSTALSFSLVMSS
jgi:hypothetical protein